MYVILLPITLYSSFILFIFQVRGKQTLGENLADNGGLHHAYLAYKRYVRKYGAEQHLPGFEDYTSNQMFFIAFGNVRKLDKFIRILIICFSF